jgi:hypothetical protein
MGWKVSGFEQKSVTEVNLNEVESGMHWVKELCVQIFQ